MLPLPAKYQGEVKSPALLKSSSKEGFLIAWVGDGMHGELVVVDISGSSVFATAAALVVIASDEIVVAAVVAWLVVAASDDVLELDGLEATEIGDTENVIATTVAEDTGEDTLVTADSCELLAYATDEVVIGLDDGVMLDFDGVGLTPSV